MEKHKDLLDLEKRGALTHLYEALQHEWHHRSRFGCDPMTRASQMYYSLFYLFICCWFLCGFQTVRKRDVTKEDAVKSSSGLKREEVMRDGWETEGKSCLWENEGRRGRGEEGKEGGGACTTESFEDLKGERKERCIWLNQTAVIIQSFTSFYWTFLECAVNTYTHTG